MTAKTDTITQRLVRCLCAPRLSPWRLGAGTIAVGAVLVLSISRVRFESDLETMIPTPSGALLERIQRAFGTREHVFVVAEVAGDSHGDAPDSSEARLALVMFAERLAKELRERPDISSVTHGYDDGRSSLAAARLLAYAPRYLEPENIRLLDETLTAADLDARLSRQVARLSLPDLDPSTIERIANDPLDLGPILARRFRRAGGAFRFAPGSPEFISEDGHAILIRIRGRAPPGQTWAVRDTVAAIRTAIESVSSAVAASFPDLALTTHTGGGYFLTEESETVVRQDLTWSLSLSLVAVLALVAWTLRGIAPTVLALPPLVIGLGLGVALRGSMRPSLTTLSLGSAAILIGIGFDFCIHLLLRAARERQEHDPVDEADDSNFGAGVEAVTRAVDQTGPGLVFAALTTAIAFLTFLLSDFPFLDDMGAITGIGIMGTLVATFVIVPPLAARWLARRRPPRSLACDRIVEFAVIRPRLVVAIAVIASCASVAMIVLRPPRFESDLRNIHARGSLALRAERRMLEIFGGSHEPLLVLLEAPSERDLETRLRETTRALDALVDSDVLAAHTSAAILLPEPTVEARWIERCEDESMKTTEPRVLEAFDRAGFATDEVAPTAKRLAEACADDEPLTLARLRELGLGSRIDDLVLPDPESPGRSLALVTIFPARALWAPATRARVVERITDDLRAAGVKSPPVGLFTVSAESASLAGEELVRIGGVAYILAAIVVAGVFRNLGTAVLVLLPVTLACVWTAAVFSLLGYSIHFMNVPVIPMIVGIGIDDGIHILHRHRGLSSSGLGPIDRVREAYSMTGTGVLLTSLTTMIAFGSLALSRNQGIASLGVLSLVGVGTALVAAVGVLPAVMAMGAQRPSSQQTPPHSHCSDPAHPVP